MNIDFRCGETEKIWHGEVSRRLPREIQQVGLRKLFMLDKAQFLDDLRIPPANRLEAFKKNRRGQHSIRINETSGESASYGRIVALQGLRLWTITE